MPKIDWFDEDQPAREPRARRRRQNDHRRFPSFELRHAPPAEPRPPGPLPDGIFPGQPTGTRRPLHLIWGEPAPRADAVDAT